MADRFALPEIIEAVPLPALAIDADERILAINAEATALFGTAAVGRHFVTIIRQPAIAEAVESCLQDGQPRQARFLAPTGGQEAAFNVSVRALAGAGPLLLTFQDVTHLASAHQMRRDFVANVSHELRTPLTALIGFIETLEGPAKDDAGARARFLEIMGREAGRMNRLVGDLLSLSRVEADERVRPTELLNLRDILQTTLRNLTPVAEENDVRLVAELAETERTVPADADQLQQVFTNLIENAIKYGGRGRQVTISAAFLPRDTNLRGPAVQVDIQDEGPGIDPVHLPRLTERFYRADNHRSRELGGTGLGLAIVKHIVSRHRGRLKITSEMGQGSRFSVVLPTGGAAEG